MSDSTERRAVGRLRRVVFDVLLNQFVFKSIAQPLKDILQLFSRENIEKHEDVSLLAELVLIDAHLLFVEDLHELFVIDSSIFSVRELLQLSVTFELLDNAILSYRQVEVLAHPFPMKQLVMRGVQLLG